MKTFENLGKKLNRAQQQKIKGGDFSGGGGGLSCEEECVIQQGIPSGCSDGQTCVNVTCEQDPSQCTNVCLTL